LGKNGNDMPPDSVARLHELLAERAVHLQVNTLLDMTVARSIQSWAAAPPAVAVDPR